MPDRMLGHFRVLSRIGAGGMGEVYRALDTKLGREVAVKLLPSAVASDQEHLRRFRDEAKALAALDHPNIVTIHSIEQAAGVTFLHMELIRGRSFVDLIGEQGVELDRFFELAIPVADAVHAAHCLGITHRDLKPANLMLTDDGRVKVLDFGLAQVQTPQRPSSDATTETVSPGGRISGTLSYMSPEQIQGRPIDARSDVFSLGVVLYELVTARRPFRGDSVPDLLASILRDDPIPVQEWRADLPPQLDRILHHCLEKDPVRRLQTALDVRNLLASLRREISEPAAAVERSIAVLPFADMSPERDQEHFCDGIAEEIIHTLGKIRDLHVVSRTSAFRFKGTSLDSREIGRRLRARTLVEGSVRRDGDRVRVTSELTNVADGYTLWSNRFDGTLENIFAIQDEIARSIAQALRITLSPEEESALGRVSTSNPEAYEFYLRGRSYYHQHSRHGMEFARQMFQRAIEKDPAYARAYAGLADCASYLCMYGGSGEETRAEAERASRKALEMEPGLAEAHGARAMALWFDGKFEEAERDFETALRLGPELFESHYFFARFCFTRGLPERAIRLYDGAMRVRPDDYQSPLLAAQIHEDLGQQREAAELRRKGVRLVEARLALKPDDTRALYLGANGLVALGEARRGLEWAGRAMAIEPEEPMVLYNVACIRSLAGDLEGAIDCLEQAVRTGLLQRDWFLRDSNLDPLRGLPRFQALMRRLETISSTG